MAKFAVVVVAVLLVTVVAGVYFQGQVSGELTEDINHEMETVAELEADAMQEWVQEQEQIARMLSELGAIQSGFDDSIDSKLDRELEQLPDSTTAIHYVDLETGTVEQSTHDEDVGTSLDTYDIRWAKGSLEFDAKQAVAISEGFEKDGQELVAFASPIEGVSYAIVVTVDAAERADHFRDPIDGGYTQVVDSHGVIEFAEDQSEALTEYPGGADARVLQEAQNGAGAFDRGDTGEVVAYAPVEGTDWVVVAHAPQSNAYHLRSTVTQDFAILVGISLLGFLFIGLTLGRNTVNALRNLSEKARAIARGDIDTEITETARIDEIGQVQDAFADTHSYLDTVATQADALARQDFNDPALQEEVPGELGDSLERMRDDMEEFITEIEQAKANAQESRKQAEELAESLEQQAVEFSDVMSRAADGDLTQRLDDDLDNEAMADIAESFNAMLDELEHTILEIQSFASDVDAASDEVASGSEEVKSASEQVARSIEEISDGTERQNESLTEVAEEMTDLSATVEEVASSTDEVAQRSQEAAERGEQGRTVAAESMEQMAEIESKTTETVDEIEQLDDEMTRIGDIVELIEEIAEQTNMLALNASIEAARAGEAGEGFAVVADEIKALAEETQGATQQIEDLITDVQESTSDATTDMREMRTLVEDGRETIEEGLTALEDIVEHVEDANAGIQSIDDATDEQAASTQEVVSMVDTVAELSEEAAGEAENVSAAAEEQTASVTQIADNAQTLNRQADKLQSMLDSFDVEQTDRALDGDETETASSELAADGGT